MKLTDRPQPPADAYKFMAAYFDAAGMWPMWDLPGAELSIAGRDNLPTRWVVPHMTPAYAADFIAYCRKYGLRARNLGQYPGTVRPDR